MKLRDLVGADDTPASVGEQYTAAHVAILRTARKRVRKMSTHDLLEWADTAGSGMAKGFMDYRKARELISLDEIRDALIALSAVVDELDARQDGENS